ncbi:hypothetical protein ABBQ38_001127 [Trebouxia sp. C0009 RCD-2024]
MFLSNKLAFRVSPNNSFSKLPLTMSIQPSLQYKAVKDLLGHNSRSVGAMLGCFCGDALGAPVEGRTWQHIAEGRLQFGQMECGCYTDDTQMTIALAQSLVRMNMCNAADATEAYVSAFDDTRGYGGSARATLTALRHGSTDYMSSGTWGFPEGSFANGGAMRIAPVGLAYRNADSKVLQQAVADALLCTHVHPEGIEGAFMQAAAVAALSNTPTPDGASGTAGCGSPKGLLQHLKSLSQVPAMQDKLQVLSDALPDASQAEGSSLIDGSNWEGDADSKAWQYDCEVLGKAGVTGFQIRAMDAAVCALWALCRHWHDPQAVIIAAVRGGGDADTIAAMAGALGGALHGTQWIPEQWFEKLENGPAGRDAAVVLALQLASLDVKS